MKLEPQSLRYCKRNQMETESQPGSSAKENVAETTKKRPLVLVVDDDPAILRLMELIHVYLQIDIQTADTAENALELLQTNSFDLMLLDCSMPVIDGFEFAALWRKYEKHAATKPLPIIAVTALRDAAAESRCWNAGMDAYIAKPLDVNTLKATIEQMLEKSNLHSTAEKP
jgi:two-component system sensor histidine kinase BarA